MHKNTLIALIAIVLLGSIGTALYFLLSPAPAQQAQEQDLGEPAVIITRTPEGYEPKEVTIKQGDVVTWVNKTTEFHWPASDLHPTHGVYPEFDPLRPIAPDEEWSFKFDKVGVWKYHDHIRANKTGTVTVTE